MLSKVLTKGKVLSVKAEVYYKLSGGIMVTHFTSPFENITISNSKGEMKVYDPKENTVLQLQGLDYSSENSFFYNFLSKKTQDMGMKTAGYRLTDTKIEDGSVITTWVPGENIQSPIGKVEIVHEKFLPIYMGFYSHKNKLVQKIYYSNYSKVADFSLPLNITEFSYGEKGDSTVSRRLYSDPKTDLAVNEKYINFQVPANAKVLDKSVLEKKK